MCDYMWTTCGPHVPKLPHIPHNYFGPPTFLWSEVLRCYAQRSSKWVTFPGHITAPGKPAFLRGLRFSETCKPPSCIRPQTAAMGARSLLLASPVEVFLCPVLPISHMPGYAQSGPRVCPVWPMAPGPSSLAYEGSGSIHGSIMAGWVEVHRFEAFSNELIS